MFKFHFFNMKKPKKKKIKDKKFYKKNKKTCLSFNLKI